MLRRRATSHRASDFSGKTDIKQNHRWVISYPPRTTWNADSVRPFALLICYDTSASIWRENNQYAAHLLRTPTSHHPRVTKLYNALVSKGGFFLSGLRPQVGWWVGLGSNQPSTWHLIYSQDRYLLRDTYPYRIRLDVSRNLFYTSR